MNLITNITTRDELLNVRDHFQRTLKDNLGNRLGKKFGQRDFDELAAKLLGVKDFNTALGIVTPAAVPVIDDTYLVSSEYNGVCAVIAGLMTQCLVSDSELHAALDGLIDDYVGTTIEISDEINNQGYERQVLELKRAEAIPAVIEALSDLTGHSESLIRDCVKQATESRVKVMDVSAFLAERD